jgi:hypothetical protein
MLCSGASDRRWCKLVARTGLGWNSAARTALNLCTHSGNSSQYNIL